MPGLIRVRDLIENCLSFDIEELISLVGDEGAKWHWNAYPYHAWLKDEVEGQHVHTVAQQVFEQIEATNKGMNLSWQELCILAASIGQTIWGTYIACENEADFARLPALYLDDNGYEYIDRVQEEFYTLMEIVFQAVDSSYWLIYVKDETIFQRIAAFFQNVETLRRW